VIDEILIVKDDNLGQEIQIRIFYNPDDDSDYPEKNEAILIDEEGWVTETIFLFIIALILVSIYFNYPL
jgi:hypothetical protein